MSNSLSYGSEFDICYVGNKKPACWSAGGLGVVAGFGVVEEGGDGFFAVGDTADPHDYGAGEHHGIQNAVIGKSRHSSPCGGSES